MCLLNSGTGRQRSFATRKNKITMRDVDIIYLGLLRALYEFSFVTLESNAKYCDTMNLCAINLYTYGTKVFYVKSHQYHFLVYSDRGIETYEIRLSAILYIIKDLIFFTTMILGSVIISTLAPTKTLNSDACSKDWGIYLCNFYCVHFITLGLSGMMSLNDYDRETA